MLRLKRKLVMTIQDLASLDLDMDDLAEIQEQVSAVSKEITQQAVQYAKVGRYSCRYPQPYFISIARIPTLEVGRRVGRYSCRYPQPFFISITRMPTLKVGRREVYCEPAKRRQERLPKPFFFPLFFLTYR